MIYPYAVLAEPPTAELGSGLCGEPLSTITCSGLALVIGAIHAAPAVSADTLKAHDAVLERLMRTEPALLPIRFGQTVAGVTELAAIAADLSVRWRAALDQVAGCAQMTTRVFGSVEPAAPQPASGTDYLRMRARQQRLPELEPLRSAVRDLVRAERAQRDERCATLYHLVPRGAAAAYRERLTVAGEAAGWRVAVSGPWAPYAFAGET